MRDAGLQEPTRRLLRRFLGNDSTRRELTDLSTCINGDLGPAASIVDQIEESRVIVGQIYDEGVAPAADARWDEATALELVNGTLTSRRGPTGTAV